jgi:hypothetical protein
MMVFFTAWWSTVLRDGLIQTLYCHKDLMNTLYEPGEPPMHTEVIIEQIVGAEILRNN